MLMIQVILLHCLMECGCHEAMINTITKSAWHPARGGLVVGWRAGGLGLDLGRESLGAHRGHTKGTHVHPALGSNPQRPRTRGTPALRRCLSTAKGAPGQRRAGIGGGVRWWRAAPRAL